MRGGRLARKQLRWRSCPQPAGGRGRWPERTRPDFGVVPELLDAVLEQIDGKQRFVDREQFGQLHNLVGRIVLLVAQQQPARCLDHEPTYAGKTSRSLFKTEGILEIWTTSNSLTPVLPGSVTRMHPLSGHRLSPITLGLALCYAARGGGEA